MFGSGHPNTEIDCKINIRSMFKTFKDKNFVVNQLWNVSWLIRSIIYKKIYLFASLRTWKNFAL